MGDVNATCSTVCVPPSGTQLPPCEGGGQQRQPWELLIYRQRCIQTPAFKLCSRRYLRWCRLRVQYPPSHILDNIEGQTWSVAGASEVLLGQCDAFLKKSLLCLKWFSAASVQMWFGRWSLFLGRCNCVAMQCGFVAAFYSNWRALLLFPHLHSAFSSL